MPIRIIKGPPNSGRTEELRRRYVEALSRRPVLVVPSTDDIFDWERRLMRGRGAFLGARIVHFKDLVNEILESGPGDRARTAGPLRRQALVRSAVSESWPVLKPRLAHQRGLADSLVELFDELRAGLIDPNTLRQRVPGDDEFLGHVAATFSSYVGKLEELGLTDLPDLAARAVTAPLERWAGRPIFVAGFDDLSLQQLSLLSALGRHTDVTVAITHEPGNPAMAVTERLLGELRREGADEPLTMEREGAGVHDPLLFEVERSFLRPGSEGSLEPGDALTIMRSSGLRGEAEAVGCEIARLVDGGVAPGDIAIAVANTAADGGRFRDRLAEFGVRATLESETPATATAIGRSVLNLLAAAQDGTARDLVGFLRGPLPVPREAVDRLERKVLREAVGTARDAATVFQGAMPPGWEALSGGGPASDAVNEVVEAMLSEMLETARGADDGTIRTESRIATAILRACRELDEILERPARSDEIRDALLSGSIKTWSVPDPESVVIASPYRLRAKRFEHLFMVSLQERGMGDPDHSGPFLSPTARSAIALPERQDPLDQERHLFYSCLSVPTRGLWLSSRVADESGKAEFPSPLVDSVEQLFDQSERPLRRIQRSAADVMFDVADAPSEEELARALAGHGGVPEQVQVAGEVRARVASRISEATAAERRSRKIESISTDEALAVLNADPTFGVTTLEKYTACPLNWFIDGAVRPSRFGPSPERMARGLLAHGVLEKLFEEPGEMPNPDTEAKWIARVEPLVDAVAADPEIGLGGDSAAERLVRTDVRLIVQAFIEDQAAADPYGFRPFMVEASFGGRASDRALDMGRWKLVGKIDRIDLRSPPGPDGDERGLEAVIIDYKTGTVATRKNFEAAGLLQLPLYMIAVREIWGLDPVAGFYVPVGKNDSRPRGYFEKPLMGTKNDPGPLTGLRLYPTDASGDGELGDAIEQIRGEAEAAVDGILAGRIDHDPGECRKHCGAACVPPPVEVAA
jgi:ATP-dependent helicase/DNAse subunit B